MLRCSSTMTTVKSCVAREARKKREEPLQSTSIEKKEVGSLIMPSTTTTALARISRPMAGSISQEREKTKPGILRPTKTMFGELKERGGRLITEGNDEREREKQRRKIAAFLCSSISLVSILQSSRRRASTERRERENKREPSKRKRC